VGVNVNCDIERRVYDSTCLMTFMHCPRKFYFRVLRGLEPKEESPAIRFGKAIHEALHCWYAERDEAKAVASLTSLPSSLTAGGRLSKEQAETIVREYIARYRDEPLIPIALEHSFELEMGCGKKLAGRMDAVVRWGQQIYVLEHKTSSSIGLFLFNNLRPHTQFDGYCLACRALFGRCDGVIVNAISTAASPRERFLRHLSARTEEELKAYRQSFKWWTDLIEKCKEEGVWPTNSSRCGLYGRCIYWELCVYGENQKLIDAKFKEVRDEDSKESESGRMV